MNIVIFFISKLIKIHFMLRLFGEGKIVVIVQKKRLHAGSTTLVCEKLLSEISNFHAKICLCVAQNKYNKKETHRR